MAIIWTDAVASHNDGWQGYSLRQCIPKAVLTDPAITSGNIRVTFIAGSSAGFNIDAAWIGTGIASPNYNYDGSQVQLTFAGATFLNGINSNDADVSDFVPFTFNYATAVSLIVAYHISGAAGNLAFDASGTGTNAGTAALYQGVATGTEGTTAPTGSWGSLAGVYLVSTIEFVAAPGALLANSKGMVRATTQPRGIVPLYG